MPISATASPIVAAAGGSFLLESRSPDEIFTPEDLSEEQRQIAATAERFAREEILPRVAAIERKEPGAMAELLRKAAELGFTAIDVPEEYGGLGMDKVSSTLITDFISVLASFSTAFGAHVGIATLPLVWYGTDGAEAALPAESCFLRLDRRVWIVRSQLRLGCHEHPHARRAFA